VVRPLLAAACLVLLVAAAACSSSSGAGPDRAPIILATTTSVNDSGLLDELVPDFERASGYKVKTIAVGTGKALAMGERGEADVLLVHAPLAERELVAKQAVVDRKLVMHNFFAIAGPASDPAAIRGLRSATDAMKLIGESGSNFVSRGDDSGTHKMELSLWSEIGLSPGGDRYLESGQGMGATLVIASEKQAYTLTDLGTYLAFQQQLRLEVLVPEAPSLLNLYSVLVVNTEKFSGANVEGARAFSRYLLSARAQGIIREFGVARFGVPLFIPDGGRLETDVTG
jgi:tungstate transport system substrate-binding protein